MSISLKTHKMLWGRAANRCSIYKIELVMDASETDDESLIGDECHIVARDPNGPRGNYPLTPEQRDNYANLILMCKVHHKLIDDQPNTYSIEKLQKMKTAHERWVWQSLQVFDKDKQRDDELYAWIVDEWAKGLDLDNWLSWSSSVLSHGQPKMSKEMDRALEELRTWLLSRIWPKRYPELEAAFENFRRILQDFQETFHEHAISVGQHGEILLTEKFYKIQQWDPPRYERLSKLYEFHVDLVEDLMLELTRAANYICDKVREYIFAWFRLKEGLILVESGPHMDMTFRTYRLEYHDSERIMYPYPGIDKMGVSA